MRTLVNSTATRLLAVLMLACAVSACTTPNVYYNSTKSHHTPTGFRNNDIGTIDKTFSELMRWQFERRQQDLPKPPAQPTPVQTPNFRAIQGYTASQAPAITWIGHATMLVQSGGLNVLTDPIFSDRASPVSFVGPRRAQPPGLLLDSLPPIDVVLISHNHYDHLDQASVRALARRSQDAGKSTRFLVPLGLKAWFAELGIVNVVELDWWDSHVVGGVTFNLTPVQHWSARSFGDRSQTLWGGFAVLSPDLHWYFSGDTGYSSDFAATRARYASSQAAGAGGGFDLALIPLGAYEPRWFLKEQHINPPEAVQIHLDLGAKRSVGLHWGTFAISDESLDQPPQDLALAARAKGLKDGEFTVMAIGETRFLPARSKP